MEYACLLPETSDTIGIPAGKCIDTNRDAGSIKLFSQEHVLVTLTTFDETGCPEENGITGPQNTDIDTEDGYCFPYGGGQFNIPKLFFRSYRIDIVS